MKFLSNILGLFKNPKKNFVFLKSKKACFKIDFIHKKNFHKKKIIRGDPYKKKKNFLKII
jgi:hypothetical protein